MSGYRSPINPKKRGKRRAVWHDYTSPCIYMITMTKNPELPQFSQLFFHHQPISSFAKSELDPAQVYCNYTPLGNLISNQIAEFNSQHPEAHIGNRVIMPDHVHFIFQVKQRLRDKSEFGRLIAQFKGACSRAYANLQANESATQAPQQLIPAFEKGFNDLICFREGQLNKFISYIKDNPRRLTIKLLQPDLFTSAKKVKIGEEYFKVIGNIFLLQHPVLEQVRFSRKYTSKEWEQKKRIINQVIDRGGVLVSPFIHPEESAIYRQALESEAGIIYIRNRDYGERDKPEGKLFDLCAEGRLLIVATGEEGQRADKIDRSTALRMNALAQAIATHTGPYHLRRL